MARAKHTTSRRRPRRRWFQFSLATLLGMFTLAALLLGWQMTRVRRQERAIEGVRESGGRVIYDFDERDPPEEKPSDSEWLRPVLGPGSIKQVDTWGEAPDELLRHLKDLPRVEQLNLSASDVTDASLVHLEEARSLKGVILFHTQITDAGLAHLEGLTDLEILMLDQTQITDDGLKHLRGMNKLWKLGLSNTRVTDAGLEHLKPLRSLKVVYLTGTQVTKHGISDLQSALPNCKIVP